jgi:tetratricopeptide (TPR) repeat protein
MSLEGTSGNRALDVNKNIEELHLLDKVIASNVFSLVLDKIAPHSLSRSLEGIFQLLPRIQKPKWLVIPFSTLRKISLPQIFAAQGSGVVQIENFEEVLDNSEIGIIINQQRDQLSNYPITLILSISDKGNNFRLIQKMMPDMWSIIGLTIELERQKSAGDYATSLYFPPFIHWAPKDLNTLKRRYRQLINTNREKFYAASIAEEIGLHYHNLKKYKLAMRWLTKALTEFSILKEVGKELEVINTALIEWIALKNAKKTMEYLEKALKLVEENPNNLAAISWGHRIWQTHTKMLAYFLQQNNLPTP